MTHLAFDDPCVLFALRRESMTFRREFRPQQRFPGAPCWARFCGPSWLSVLAVETGMGAEEMEKAISWLLGSPLFGDVPYRPKLVLSAGFSGALQEGRNVGDIVLATEVINVEGRSWSTTWPGQLPAGNWKPALHRGRILTVPHFVTGIEEKRSLGQQHDALAVDMETSIVAQRCSERGVPFGCVRAISDDWRTPLSPKLASLLRGGRVSPLRVLAALLTKPRLAREMHRLAKQTRLAAYNLGTALGELLTLTLPWGREL